MRDQCDYTAEALFRHVDCIWIEEYVLKAKDEIEIKSKGDPAIGPELPVIVADIRKAWERCGLDSTERQVFTLRQLWGFNLGTIAEVYQITEQEVADVLDGTTAQILRYLNRFSER